VVVIPGYGGQTALLRPLIQALRRDGRDVHLVTGLGSATSNLRAQARVVGRQVDRLIRDGAPSVDVIGFSAGGLVSRIWAEDGGSAVTRRVVTLGAPHHGSEVAELAGMFVPRECPVACRQLSPGSTLLQRLDDAAPGPRWVSVWTRDDRISTPPRTAVLDGALSIAVQDVCPGARVEHGMLPRTEFVVDLVVMALDAADPLVSAPATAGSRCPAPS
jgi:triacylglycerol esterase/lipase EstA (alpha/beta hydrolase family)